VNFFAENSQNLSFTPSHKYTQKQKVKIQISNVIGEYVLQGELTSRTNDIDLSVLPKGIYFLKIINQNSLQTIKLVKQYHSSELRISPSEVQHRTSEVPNEGLFNELC